MPTDMNVYDAAALSARRATSACSRWRKRGQPVEFPDFTRGRWKHDAAARHRAHVRPGDDDAALQLARAGWPRPAIAARTAESRAGLMRRARARVPARSSGVPLLGLVRPRPHRGLPANTPTTPAAGRSSRPCAARTRGRAGPRTDGIVVGRRRAVAGRRWIVRPASERRMFAGWANYVAVVARRLASNFPGAELGADLVFDERSPACRRLIVQLVGARRRIASALVARASWPRAAGMAVRSLRGRLDLAGLSRRGRNGLTFGELEAPSTASAARRSEDHTAISPCRARSAPTDRARPAVWGDAAMPADWRFVVMAQRHRGRQGRERPRALPPRLAGPTR